MQLARLAIQSQSLTQTPKPCASTAPCAPLPGKFGRIRGMMSKHPSCTMPGRRLLAWGLSPGQGARYRKFLAYPSPASPQPQAVRFAISTACNQGSKEFMPPDAPTWVVRLKVSSKALPGFHGKHANPTDSAGLARSAFEQYEDCLRVRHLKMKSGGPPLATW